MMLSGAWGCNAVEANLDHSRYMELHAYTTEKQRGIHTMQMYPKYQ